MNCPHCDRPNRDGRRFCGGCGVGLTAACTMCEFVNEATDRFCGGCGAAIARGTRMAPRDAQASNGVPMLSPAELASLLSEVPAAAVDPVTLPQGPIGQDDLDRLFGGGP